MSSGGVKMSQSQFRKQWLQPKQPKIIGFVVNGESVFRFLFQERVLSNEDIEMNENGKSSRHCLSVRK